MTSSEPGVGLKGRFQMNCCLVCNKRFCMEKTTTLDDGKVKVANLCKILQVSFDEEHFEPEINPTCSHCTMMASKYFIIEKRIQNLILTLGKLKEMLAKKVVVSYKSTRPNRKNSQIKRMAYDAWVSKLHVLNYNTVHSIDEPSIQTKDANPSCRGALSVPLEQQEDDFSSSPLGSPHHDDHDYSDDNDNGNSHDKDQAPDSIKPGQQHVNVSDKCIKLDSRTKGSENQQENNNQHHHQRSELHPVPKMQLGRQQHCCRTCSKIFPTLFSLSMHERLHTGEKPFECSVCSRRFNVKCNRDKHEKTHDLSRKQGEPEFTCDLCGKKYHLKDSLHFHKRQHALGKVRLPSSKPKVTKAKKKSPKCEVSSLKKKTRPKTKNGGDEEKTKLAVADEILDEYNNDDDGIHEDADSEINPDASKKRRLKLQRRLVKKAKSSKIKVKVIIRKSRPRKNKTCTDCQKTFATAYGLMLHMRIHTDAKPHQCEICLRTFRRPESKIKHMATHKENRFQGQRSHICDICGKLQHQHRRHVHLGIPKTKEGVPLNCTVCGKIFSRAIKLKEHMIRHTGRKKFPCSVCQKPFYTPSEAKNHANNYHNPKKLHLLFKHKCPACPPGYVGMSSKKAVKQHWLECHPDQPVPEEFSCIKSKPASGSNTWECKDCPEGMRPVYKYKETYQRHYKKFHADGTGRGGKRNRPYQLTRRNVRALEMGKKICHKKDDDESMESDSTTSSEEADNDSRNVQIKRSRPSRNRPVIKVKPISESQNQTKELRIILQKIEQDDVACEKYYILQQFKKNI